MKPLVAPLLKLGQVSDDPPYEILDIHVDHLGSTRVVTDESGGGVTRHDFFPFGEEITSMADDVTKMFTGHERDRETGLDYMLARYYGTNLGRFLSTDPVVKRRKNSHFPRRWNRYAYSLNNPINYFDPDGLDVTVAANARSSVEHGYMHSAEFRAQFDAAKSNPHVDVTLKLGSGQAHCNCTVTGPKLVTQNVQTGEVKKEFAVEGTAEAPAGQGKADGAAKLGHELAHVNNMAANGPETQGTPAAEEGERKADEAEEQIEDDLEKPEDDVSQETVDKALEGTEPKRKGTP